MTAAFANPEPADPMAIVAPSDPIVLVLAEGPSTAAVSNAKGHLFEKFVARLLNIFGYNEPTQEKLNVTAEGIELDVVAVHEMNGQQAVAECKAYSSPVAAEKLDAFYGKLATRRFSAPNTQGYFVALPRLTPPGQEQASRIQANDPAFKVLTATGVVELLRSRNLVVGCPLSGLVTSDPAVLVTEHGTYAACLDLDPARRTATRALVWATSGPVPHPVIDAFGRTQYAGGAPVVDARQSTSLRADSRHDAASLIVTVSGSRSDFEYHLPASPAYFVGRKRLVEDLSEAIESKASVLVLNAQSGWGKSSLALRLKAATTDRGGYALIVDSRTASSSRFVTDALSRAAGEAASQGVLTLASDASWATLSSALRTLGTATWHHGPLVVFFDQFENVFRDESLTREFRDLALGAPELMGQLLVGFAWKTDLVGWTESHPYRFRDEIRANARVLMIGPLGVREIDTLLRRLDRALRQPLARDLRQRLREYSQGLPWLFKKLAGHLLREVANGATQEQLASEVLNVQSLFEADLAELGPGEHEALKYIARHAPISISEVMERVGAPIVETLVNRRLVVQVGERLDTYWDIFRDYLNSGRIPVEDSYILRQSPVSVARLLREVIKDDGDSRVPDIAARFGIAENGVFNLSRELRLFGATSYEPNRVRLLPEIWQADDKERELRRRVSVSLRRHRAYSTFLGLAERVGEVTISSFSRDLPSAFPAVEVVDETWIGYARAFLQWFEYAGLAVQRSSVWSVAPEGTKGVGELLGGRVVRRVRGGFPQQAPRPSIELLLTIAARPDSRLPRSLYREDQAAARSLLTLGVLEEEPDGDLILVRPNVVADGAVVQVELRQLLQSVPGVAPGLALISANPAATAQEVGHAVRDSIGADWAPGTSFGVGKHLRAWARCAGLSVHRPPRRTGVGSEPTAQ